MIHLKYLSIVLSISIISFYMGLNVGAQKMGVNRDSNMALFRAENRKVLIEDSSESRLKMQLYLNKQMQEDALYAYGYYLNSFSYKIPVLTDLDSSTENNIKTIVSLLLEKDPDYFNKSYKKYDTLIKESKEIDKKGTQQYEFYKSQLKKIEDNFK